MKRFSSLLNRTKSSTKTPSVNIDTAPADSPEATVARAIQDFCQSTDNDAEVIHLPLIVDSAESSPVACTAAAQQIRKFLTKDYSKHPHAQTKAVMLIRILSDNPGPNFTRNFDKQFNDTIKTCLRNCNDSTTQQLLRETLDTIEFNKGYDETVQPLVAMWKKEKGAHFSYAAVRRPEPGGAFMSGGGHGRHSRQLPPPEELASRIEEAKNTAKILLQLIQTTPSDQVLANDLLREFGDRCHMAIKSMQNYMNSTAPAPDDDTMQTLIETTEQLSLANSRYQRTMLAARRAAGLSSPSPRNESESAFAPPPGPPTSTNPATTNGHGTKEPTFGAPNGPPPTTTSATGAPTLPPVNPFADPEPQATVPQTTQNFAINTEPTYAGTGSARSDLHTSHSENEDPYSSSPVRTKPPVNLHSDSQVPEIDSHGQVGRAPAQR